MKIEAANGAAGILAERLAAPDVNLAELTVTTVIEAANNGVELACESSRRAIRNLGWLAHLFALIENPSAIVFLGPLNALGDWLRLEIRAPLANYLRLPAE